jgi:hypothetical protein
LRASLGERAQEIERRRIRPVQVLEGEDNRLRPRASQKQSSHCRQLPAPQLLGRKGGHALRRQWNVHKRRNKGRVLPRVEANQPQRVLEICEALIGGSINAKSQAAPLGNRMQRRVLEEL